MSAFWQTDRTVRGEADAPGQGSWINDVQAAGLKLVKESEDISESEQIRQALNEWLKRRGALKVKTERKRVSPRSRS